jgi:hypothetical protein
MPENNQNPRVHCGSINVRFHFLLILLVLGRFFCAGAIGKSTGPAGTTRQDTVSTPIPAVTATGSESPTDSPTPAEPPKISHGSIEPPFGLRWGESKEEVKNQLTKAGVQILKRPKVDDREVLAIEGIRQPSLLQAIAYFDAQKLAEVELQYGDSAWTFDAYRAFVVSITRRLQAYYGEPTVLERDRRSEGDRVETIAGYQWQLGDSSGVLLFFFSVEQGKNSYITVSIHYRVELPEAPATPDKPPISDNSGKRDESPVCVRPPTEPYLRLKPIAFHRDLLRFWIFAGLDFVRRVAGCSDSGY